jgi:3-hydroxyisobutyrate dehydrogenase
MGGGMARRLCSAQFPLAVWNRNPEKAKPLADQGATIARTPREAAGQADVIISMLADDVASRSVWLGQDGALAGAKPGTMLVECSTLSVGWVKELAEHARERQCELLDAPVTGTKPHAAAGELNFLVGGSEKALESIRPVLMAMGKSATHLGPTGSGAIIKLINNFLCAAQMIGLAEGLSMVERSGLNRDQAMTVLSNGAAGSPLFKMLSTRMTARDFTPNFMLRLLVKDVTYAINEARSFGLELTTAQNALAMLRRAVDAGDGDKDMSVVVETIRKSKTT